MPSNAQPDRKQPPPAQPLERPRRGARALLPWGVLAGPFYLIVGVSQGLLREGFDFSRHPLSVLANGPFGWVQTANFVITGAMVIAAAIGIGRALAPKSRGLTFFLVGYGLCMIAASVFPADPVDGFPVGTPVGPPTSISTRGLLHFVAGGLAFLSLAISCFCAFFSLRRHKLQGLAWISLAAGFAIIAGFFSGVIPQIGVLGIWFAVVVGWAWLALISFSLRQRARS